MDSLIIVNSLDEADAHRLAAEVRSWWHIRGFVHVTVEVIQIITGHRRLPSAWSLRSNLVNGLPPGASPSQVAEFYKSERRFA